MLRRNTVAAFAAAALAVPVLAGCGAGDAVDAANKALDCATTAATVAEAADDLQQAASEAADDPAQARESLNTIDKNLDKIRDETDDADVGKAVNRLGDAVESVRSDVEDGRVPSTAPVGKAADELTAVCTPG